MKRNFIILLLTFFNLFVFAAKPKNTYVKISTNYGEVYIKLYNQTPKHRENFIKVVNEGTLNGTLFHRVIQEFMIQGGDPLGTGSGDAGYRFKDEITDLRFDKGGVLAMANNGPATNSSQFFITHVETPWLNGMHTIFGHVVENGM